MTLKRAVAAAVYYGLMGVYYTFLWTCIGIYVWALGRIIWLEFRTAAVVGGVAVGLFALCAAVAVLMAWAERTLGKD